jgi:PAS domain S-box-containing protein
MMANQLDYIVFAVVVFVVFGVLHLWLQRYGRNGRVSLKVWSLLITLTIAGWFFVEEASRQERSRIQRMVEGFAPTYAQEMERMGHSKITLDTSSEDPLYLSMLEAEIRWQKVNPAVSDIYTFRKREDGKTVLIVDSETDYDRNGKFEGDRESRTAIGEVFDKEIPALERAFGGKASFTDEIYTDRWGTWVSAFVPMFDKSGRVEAVLGVDYAAENWRYAITLARTRVIGLLSIILTMLAASTAMVALMRADLAERKRAEERLTRAKKEADEILHYVDSIIANMIDTLIVLDPNGIIQKVNEAAFDLLGYKAEELIGQPVSTIFAEEESPFLSSKTSELIKRGFIGHFEKILLAKDGHRVPVAFSGSVMRDEQGKISGIICVARDLTELKQAEEVLKLKNDILERTLQQLRDMQNQLITQEKLASLGALTAGIAHEIKNPLNFVNNFAQLSAELASELRQTIEEQKEQLNPEVLDTIKDLLDNLEQDVSKINEHGKRADRIVHNMLMHSRGRSGEVQPTRLNSLLAEDINLAYHGMRAKDSTFNVSFQTDFDPSIESVKVIPQDVSRVFLNIINNACYAVHQKKKKLEDEYSPTVWISTKNLGKKIEVRIRDNGTGIPQSIVDKVFNPFFTTKPTGEGTGLGLSISYDIIVQEHKGEIRVETEEGQYAEFIITLPSQGA